MIPFRSASVKILALDEFHHEGTDAIGFFETVDRRDGRMVQGGERLRLAGESGDVTSQAASSSPAA
jgi:hypothetical protein